MSWERPMLAEGRARGVPLRRVPWGRREAVSFIDEMDAPPLPKTLAIAVMVFQLRVVTGTPKSRSNVPR
jgi:hypothetical protein